MNKLDELRGLFNKSVEVIIPQDNMGKKANEEIQNFDDVQQDEIHVAIIQKVGNKYSVLLHKDVVGLIMAGTRFDDSRETSKMRMYTNFISIMGNEPLAKGLADSIYKKVYRIKPDDLLGLLGGNG